MRPDKLLDYIAWTLLAISWIFLGWYGRLIDNIIGGLSFVGLFVALGTCMAALFLGFIRIKYPAYYQHATQERASAVLSWIFGLAVLTLFSAAQFSEYLAKHQPYQKQAVLQSKTVSSKYRTPYVHLQIHTREERFSPDLAVFKQLQPGDTLQLTVGKGLLGYEVVLAFL